MAKTLGLGYLPMWQPPRRVSRRWPLQKGAGQDTRVAFECAARPTGRMPRLGDVVPVACHVDLGYIRDERESERPPIDRRA